MKFVLSDKTQFDIVSFVRPLSVAVVAESIDTVKSLWDSMTDEALESAQVVEDGKTLARFTDVKKTGVQCVVNPGGTLTAHFYLSATEPDTEADAEYTKAAKILLGEVE